jgi:hypothetical protein
MKAHPNLRSSTLRNLTSSPEQAIGTCNVGGDPGAAFGTSSGLHGQYACSLAIKPYVPQS